MAERPLADPSRNQLSLRLLAIAGFTDFGNEFFEIALGPVEGVLAFELGPERDLEQLGRWKAPSFQLVVEIVWQVDLEAGMRLTLRLCLDVDRLEQCRTQRRRSAKVRKLWEGTAPSVAPNTPNAVAPVCPSWQGPESPLDVKHRLVPFACGSERSPSNCMVLLDIGGAAEYLNVDPRFIRRLVVER